VPHPNGARFATLGWGSFATTFVIPSHLQPQSGEGVPRNLQLSAPLLTEDEAAEVVAEMLDLVGIFGSAEAFG